MAIDSAYRYLFASSISSHDSTFEEIVIGKPMTRKSGPQRRVVVYNTRRSQGNLEATSGSINMVECCSSAVSDAGLVASTSRPSS